MPRLPLTRDSGVMFIAGGTDLMGLMKDHVVEPAHLLDINHLPSLNLTEPTSEGGLRIGALTRMSDVAIDMGVRQRAPMISEALLFSASTQLRNMVSMGGNLVQRTRCAYFRDVDGTPCNKRSPGSGCSARHGINRNQAIFGWSDACLATHPSDVAVALSALDCTVRVHSPQGVRAVPIGDFYRLPRTTPTRTISSGAAMLSSVWRYRSAERPDARTIRGSPPAPPSQVVGAVSINTHSCR
jgi:xanthine dehydrogenase YagS FAD-binding subunit